MKLKTIPTFLFALSMGMAPSVFANGSAYHNQDRDRMTDRESADANNMNRNKKSTFSTYGNNSKTMMNKDMVKQVQEKLKDNNFSVGKVDGIYGPKTRSALMDYQRSEDLNVTGRLNRETLDSLGIDSSNFSSSNEMYSE